MKKYPKTNKEVVIPVYVTPTLPEKDREYDRGSFDCKVLNSTGKGEATKGRVGN